jgi:transcription factor SPN1
LLDSEDSEMSESLIDSEVLTTQIQDSTTEIRTKETEAPTDAEESQRSESSIMSAALIDTDAPAQIQESITEEADKSRASSRSSSRSVSRSGSSRSQSATGSGSRSRSCSRSSSRSRSVIRSDSESGDDIGQAKKRVVREAFGSDDDQGKDFYQDSGKKKRKRIISGDSDEDKEAAHDGDAQPEAVAEGGPAPVLPVDDSSDDERPVPDDGGQNTNISDFDIMMECKKAEMRKRRKKKDIDLINDNDDAIAKMIADMRMAARDDQDLNATRQPATRKISMLPAVMTQLNKADLQMAFVEANVLSVLTDWLAPMPDKSLPSVQIRKAILKLLFELRLDDHTRLKESGIGKAVMYLFKHPRELRSNKDLAGTIINQWARPIFNLSTDFKSVSREERIARDEMSESRRKPDQERQPEGEEPLKPGDPGWCYRARVPQSESSSYVNRPEWGSQVDITNVTKKQQTRIERHMRKEMERKKHSKAKRAIEISIEGRKMSL